jgi:UDPglucose 6-dehydrogenase
MVGTGYVGLVSGACFAEVGHNVSCVDIDRGVIEGLRSGAVHVFEPGLGELVRRNVSDGRLIFTCDISEGLRDAEICFVAVGTPSGDNGETELRFVYSAAGEIASAADRDCIVAVKSTAPVGTCGVVQDMISAGLGAAGRSDISIEVASNPEFLKEGSAVSDFLNPDRVVAGVSSERARVLMETLYSSFVPPERIIFMDIASAEITKYACNAMLAARISFINEIALLCDVAGADVTNVRAGMALDPRIGGQFLNAGCGYGGSCFPKDIQALDQTGRGLGLEMKMASATSLVNERQKRVLGGMVVERFGKNLKGLCIAVLGLAFKPNTDDMRYAPSIPLVRTLATLGADVVAVDPAACDRARDLLPQGVRFADTAEMALRGADAAILVTEWADFRSLDWRDCGSRMRRRILFDGRNIFDPSSIRALGFEYYCIGRGCVVGGANGGRSRQRDAGRA